MSTSSVSQAAPRAGLRQKRRQVARACEGCRIHRIKCDDEVPCSNCRAKGKSCSNSAAPSASSLAQAQGEIGRLRQRIRELEGDLDRERSKSLTGSHISPPLSNLSSPTGREADHGAISKVWEGIQVRPTRSPYPAWFGPSSLYHFISRLSVHLSSSLEQTHHDLLPQSASHKLLNPAPGGLDREGNFSYPDMGVEGVFLSPTQEEYFINLFWQTFHTSLYAVLDETEFKKHYQSLWIPSTNSRKPSALVDVVIAMCMQYGISALPAESQGGLAEGIDATLAGRWHYRRSQMLLASELDCPTISTLQCYLLCVAYLCGGSFHNMVDSSSGLAARTAYQLGLHIEPPANMPEQERQMRMRLWWAVYFLDSKVGMKLGRPFLLQSNDPMPSLPGDQHEHAMLSGSMFAPIGQDATWLSFNLHHVKLYKVFREAHMAFYSQDLGAIDSQTVWNNPWAMDTLAEVLISHAKDLDDWVRGVPDALKIKREDGEAFSTTGSPLKLEQYAPLWLQRQRVLLELTYHHLSVNLYRPLISFTTQHQGSAAQIALKCAAHAVELSKINQQVLSSTSILDGWHEAFQWQWSAAMSLVGYLLAVPHGTSTPAARNALDLSVMVFDLFGTNFEVSASAASIMRYLTPIVDSLINRGQSQNEPVLTEAGQSAGDQNQDLYMGDAALNYQDLVNFDLFDMAVNVDFWADLDTLWPGNPTQGGLLQ